jgi:5-methyltetrahydrofolate--homocysteine methyltransferase
MSNNIYAAGNVRKTLNAIAARRIIILDGAMGSLIQSYGLTEEDFRGGRFAGHPVKLLGCNDLLCLSRPDLIRRVHAEYLEAGADITKTCSFNATAVSLEHFGLAGYAYEISRAAAALARETADRFSTPEKPRFVAGSLGPTAKNGSLPPDINCPEKRAVTWDELAAAYYDNARGLLDGGADILLIETIIDTLNAKAAIFAINRLLGEGRPVPPLMLSATMASAASTGGRILAGQNLAAFCVSVAHAEPWALGLNCSFGAETLKSSAAELGALSARLGGSWLTSAHPNAGLPNRLGGYDESPESMALKMEPYFKEGLLNIAGGCCGTTPAHIAALAELAKRYPPRPIPGQSPSPWAPVTRLSALVDIEIGNGAEFTVIGEGAEKGEFFSYLREENYDDALAMAAAVIGEGASIIEVRVDDEAPDADRAMRNFLNFALQDPEFARTPLMLSSSRWDLIEAGLKCAQGKCLVNCTGPGNSGGEPEEFARRAGIARSFGAALVVALAATPAGNGDPPGGHEQIIERAGRAWRLFRDSGFPAQDLVFDPGVPEDIVEHDPRVPGFIRACAWIRNNCPGARILGRLSNLRPGFGDTGQFQAALGAVFLEHAIDAGLGMAVTRPARLVPRGDIDAGTRKKAEALLFGA